jgi:hypothetical protein
MEEGLDEILNGGPADEPQAEELAPETEAERPRDEKGRFAPKETGGEPAAETPAVPEAASAPPAPEPDHIPIKALQDERAKRQELERRLQHMESMLQSRTQPTPEQPPEFWEDPDRALQSRLDQFGQSLLQQFEQRQYQQRADQAEAAARAKYPDYDDAFAKFREQVQVNPSLAQELARVPDPAEFAYQRGKQALKLSSIGDLDAYEAQIRAQARAEYEAELRGTLNPAAPLSTATDRSVGARTGPTWTGPKSISEILR